MRNKIILTLGSLTVVLWCGWHLAASETAVVLQVNSVTGVSTSISLAVEDPVGLLSAKQAGNTTTYSDGNFQIQVTETPGKARSIIHVVAQKISKQAFRMSGFSITARVLRNPIQGIWDPGAEPSSTNVMSADANQAIDDIAEANFGVPYVGAVSALSRNVFAMGLGRQDLSVSITGQPDGTFYELRLRANSILTSTKFDESFYLSSDATMGWSDTATDYANWVDAISNYSPFPVSRRAYEPLYDAWYWAGDQVDERLYLDTAKLASDLGIGLYLADSGWDTENGEYSKWLAGKTGDYSPPPGKFSNLPETFAEMRAGGRLGIDLWLQPFAVGRESVRYPATRDMHIQLPVRRYPVMGWEGVAFEPFTLPLGNNLESVNLCPRLSSTQTYLRNLFAEVATTYKPEGYWLDFIDGMASYCVAPHAHTYATFGEGLQRSLQTIKDTILTYDPQAIVHFRARYANLNTKPFANIWQSGDAPADFDRMRLNSLRLRPFSTGVVFAADEMYWPDSTPEPQVAKFIMTSVMVGVPSFGPTLLYSPPATLEMLKAWMTFYRSNQIPLATGRFSTFGQLGMPNHKIESGDRTFAYIRNLGFTEMAAQGKTIFLMNATTIDRFIGRVRPTPGAQQYSIRVLNRFLVAEPNEMRANLDRWGLLNLNLAVQQGGMVVLTPTDATP